MNSALPVMPHHSRHISLAVSVSLLVLALAGCAVAPRQAGIIEPNEECREVFRRTDRALADAGVQDGMAARVAGFPYLRVNRFLASYADEDMSDAQFAQWMSQLIALGTRAHAIEVANLPAGRKEALEHDLWDIGRRRAWSARALADCAEQLAAADYADPERRQMLKRAARVPDDYATTSRVLGLYWLTRIPFASGVRQWQRTVRETFAQPLDALPLSGRLAAYVPPPGAGIREKIAALLARASDNPLGIPDPVGVDLEWLFRAYAPAFAVDTASDADRPGELGWDEGGLPAVVSRLPLVYRRVSHVRHEGRALLQLNYSIWFPERPRSAGWDMLGGRLDGVLWRVTLAPDGDPWVFDSIHLCGCYHQFFPTSRATLKAQPVTLDEGAFVPQELPRIGANERITLRLAASTHYLQRVAVNAVPAETPNEYIFADDDALRSVPLPEGGRRSVFRPDGIVPGTERGERWLFWPMGVSEPGAMRQWGRHATAFVGRRHFDDPGLLERYFTLEQR